MADKKYVEAKVSRNQKRYHLATVKDGWIEVVRMDHGQSLARMDEIFIVSMSEDGKRSSRASNLKARHFDFASCIVDHNLSFNGDPCDFASTFAVDELDEDIGDEIQNIINQHHGRGLPDTEGSDTEGPESDPN